MTIVLAQRDMIKGVCFARSLRSGHLTDEKQ